MDNLLTFGNNTLPDLCNRLTKIDNDLATIVENFGYPPYWSRSNTFESLVHIILEQQVSLASALAALNKLKDNIQQVTPARFLLLSDEQLRACYFSRQKTTYVRNLAENLLCGAIDLEELESLPNEKVRLRLTALKGIGNWTADIYLLMVLHRTDIFPIGDLAIINALKKLKNLPVQTPKEELLQIAEQWRPYRSIGAMLVWHYYLSC
ncbi:DNA-3-methyladenine glycosylase 2 family protein [uncultured Mucilaginibacter sp.]|uniref:DNA-3-methyladenine glycosylase family protein n=1 Tax=uncultured Mucilaginibacter sp. TaxID=797541 RepID=UPI0025F5A0DC|nr:DNA-3-methyladenine glycosylase 2 family protein [uncultured Mucilaginibacter sp.]